MKKKILILICMIFGACAFAKTQKVVKYQVYNNYYTTYDVTPAINSMIKQGWYVVSITPVTLDGNGSSPTDYVIVVYEKED